MSGELERACTFLKTELHEGQKRVADLRWNGSASTLRRARQKLGVVSRKGAEGKSFLRLPNQKSKKDLGNRNLNVYDLSFKKAK
jgi:hypothetical protein